MKWWSIEIAIVAGAALIAASIAVTERYQISAIGYGYGNGDTSDKSEGVYRLDRWTGEIDYCDLNFNSTDTPLRQIPPRVLVPCGAPPRHQN